MNHSHRRSRRPVDPSASPGLSLVRPFRLVSSHLRHPLRSVFQPRRCGYLVALALCAGAMFPVQADDRIEARRHFQTGMTLIQEGKLTEGIRKLEAAYQILPHPSVLFNIGRAYMDLGRYDEAVEYLQRYLGSDPPDRDVVVRLLEQGRRARATTGLGGVPRIEQPSPVVGTGGPAQPGSSSGSTKDELQSLSLQLQAFAEQLARLSGGVGGTVAVPRAVRHEQQPSKPQEPSSLSDRSESTADREESKPSDGADGAGVDPYAPVVVTASRYNQSPLEAPNAITVFSGDDLRRSGARNIPELLRRIPGVDVMAVSPGDYNIGIRGFNATLSNKVLLLVDGRSLYLDFVGASLWPLLSISASDVERIEVIRGPGAALYGANAFSGVINIITRNPGAPNDPPHVTLEAGDPDYALGDLHLTGRSGQTGYRASMGVERIDRWSMEIHPDRPDYDASLPYPDQAVRTTRFDARLDHRLGTETSVSVSGGLSTGQVEFAAAGSLRDFFIDGSYGYLRGDMLLPDGFSVRAFWNHFDAITGPWTIPRGALDLTSHPVQNIFDLEVESHREFHLGVDHRLNLGLGYRFKTIAWEWLGSTPKEHHGSFFVQDEARLRPRLTGTVSLRLDRHPVLAAQEEAPWLERYALSPRGALVWLFAPGQSIRGTVGTAFRTPSFIETYNQLKVPTGTDAVVALNLGNLELQPERILSTEVGYLNQPANSRYEIEATAYLNRVDRLMELSPVEPWTDPATAYDAEQGLYYAGTTGYVNAVETYTAVGGELGGRWFPRDGIDLFLNYAYTYIQKGAGEEATRILSTSPSRVNAGFQVRRGGLSLASSLHYVDAQTWTLRSFDAQGNVVNSEVDLPSYVWVSARLGYRLSERRIELALEGNNLLAPLQSGVEAGERRVETPEWTHREYPLGQTIPLSIWSSLTYRFW